MRPREGIQPRYSGLRVQGTATSPLSTANPKLVRNFIISVPPEHCQGDVPHRLLVRSCRPGLLEGVIRTRAVAAR